MRRDDVARFLISVRKEMTARDVINELAQCGVSSKLVLGLGCSGRIIAADTKHVCSIMAI